MSEIFPRLVENIKLHTEESQQTPGNIKTKTFPRAHQTQTEKKNKKPRKTTLYT